MLKVDQEKCNGDKVCVAVCPVGAPHVTANGKITIDAGVCIECYACMNSCPQGAISEDND